MLYKAPCRVRKVAWIRKPLMTATIGFISLILINIGSSNDLVYAEQKITIIPDAHSDTAVRFVDVTNYFIQVGEELTWFNDNFVSHKLILTNEDNTTRLADLDLPSNSSAFYLFDKPGKYYYSSKDYPKIQGSIKVVDREDISVDRVAGLKNGVDVQLAWTPSHIILNSNNSASLPIAGDKNEGTQAGKADFIITFIDNKTGTNQEHIDYEYLISDKSGNPVFSQGSHSTYGIEEGRFEIDEPETLNAQVIITHILFAPVDPDVAKFEKSISVN